MAERQCTHCKATMTDGKGWAECPTCGTRYCADCSPEARNEAAKIEKLRTGDGRTRVGILCPGCQMEMFRVMN